METAHLVPSNRNKIRIPAVFCLLVNILLYIFSLSHHYHELVSFRCTSWADFVDAGWLFYSVSTLLLGVALDLANMASRHERGIDFVKKAKKYQTITLDKFVYFMWRDNKQICSDRFEVTQIY